MRRVKISARGRLYTALLNNSETAERFYGSLPVSGTANVWGEEVYFTVPFHVELDETAQEEVPVGGLAFWPSGDAFCIFFGPTPVSVKGEPRAYSAVNVFGQIEGDTSSLKNICDGDVISVESAG